MLNVIILKFDKFCGVTPLWNASMFLQARQKKKHSHCQHDKERCLKEAGS